MKANRREDAAIRLGALALVATCSLLLGTAWLFAQDFRITDLRVASTNVIMSHQADTNSYYVLYRGNEVRSISLSIDAALGESRNPATGFGQLSDSSPAAGSAFYRIERIPLSAPRDTDHDGIDDVYELRHAQALNPVNAADAAADFDQDSISNLDEYLAGTDPLVPAPLKIQSTSPSDGESGVAITRETIIRLSQPLASNAVVTVSNFFATFAGQTMLARRELSSDRRTITLFYQQDLPPNARIRVTFNGAGLRDHANRLLDVDEDGQPGGVRLIDFDTLNNVAVTNTAVEGRVFASEPVPAGDGAFTNRPLQGVRIEVVGAEETLFTTTDASGRFRLRPAPPGRFFVNVDGRTALGSSWPNGSYYPTVGKAWEAVAGQTNLANGTGEIHLPLIVAGTLQPVSAGTETVITFPPSVIAANPEFAGVEVRVPANALYDNNGVRGGRVGIAPVSPDRLPEPLPPGLELPLVITIQTDGPLNFDRPAPVRFPNMPDPDSGVKLPPGAKTALWSFNHDTGRWEMQGRMTVSADGNYVDTDPGVGVRQPGWHGVQQGGRGHNGRPCGPPPTDQSSVSVSVPPTTTELPPRPANPSPPPAPLASAPPPETAPPGFVAQSQRHHWALECLYPSASVPVQRGVGDSSGVINDNFILAPGAYYRLWIVQDQTCYIGFADFTTPETSGFDIAIPKIVLHQAPAGDADGDRLLTLVEFVIGSSDTDNDTDNDGLNDFAEFKAGLNPTDGLAISTGIIFTAPLPGVAKDISAANNLAVLALGTEGIAVFDIRNGLNPRLIARLSLPGDAQDVALGGPYVAVALGSAGLGIVHINDPAWGTLTHQLNLGAPVISMAADGGGWTVFAGLGNGQLVVVDAMAGTELGRVTLLAGQPVLDLELIGNRVLALFAGQVCSFPLPGSGSPSGVFMPPPVPANFLALPGGVNNSMGRNRIATDGRYAYASHRQGYNYIDLNEPTNAVLVRNVTFPMFGWKQVLPTGTGIGVALADANEALDGPNDVQIIDLTHDTVLATISTPGIARAGALYGGLALVADQNVGLQVVNYLAFDTANVPPTIRLQSSAPPAGIEEGQPLIIRALVDDDVQVATVEFQVDGRTVFVDGGPPYELRINAPRRTPGVTSTRISAKAFDTGGNVASAMLDIPLLADSVPPRVIQTTPGAGQVAVSVSTIVVAFSEAVDPATVIPANFRLTNLLIGDNGDLNFHVSYRSSLNSAVLTLETNLPAGFKGLTDGVIWQFAVHDVADAAGNVMTSPFTASFRVLGGQDSDHDGVPDTVESALGLNPFNPDTDLDGIPDGKEDFDGDGLPNAVEIAAGTNPQLTDSDYNGLSDANEDPDQDSLVNSAEAATGTDPGWHDSDEDRFNDGAEITVGSDPLDPQNRPIGLFASQPVAVVNTQPPRNANNEVLGVTPAYPSAGVISPAISLDTNGAVQGVWPGQPAVFVRPASAAAPLSLKHH